MFKFPYFIWGNCFKSNPDIAWNMKIIPLLKTYLQFVDLVVFFTPEAFGPHAFGTHLALLKRVLRKN